MINYFSVHSNKTLHEVAAYLKLLPSPDDAGVEGNREFLLEMLVSYCWLIYDICVHTFKFGRLDPWLCPS